MGNTTVNRPVFMPFKIPFKHHIRAVYLSASVCYLPYTLSI